MVYHVPYVFVIYSSVYLLICSGVTVQTWLSKTAAAEGKLICLCGLGMLLGTRIAERFGGLEEVCKYSCILFPPLGSGCKLFTSSED